MKSGGFSILGLIFIIASYFVAWKTWQQREAIGGQLTNAIGGVTGGLRGALSKGRSNAIKQRWGEYRAGQRGDTEHGGVSAKKPLSLFKPKSWILSAANQANKFEAAGKPGGKYSGTKAETAAQAHTLHSAQEAVKRDNNREGGDDDSNEFIAQAHSKSQAHAGLVERTRVQTREKALAKAEEGRTFANDAQRDAFRSNFRSSWNWSADERAKAEKDAQTRLDRWENSFGLQIGTGTARVAAAMSLFNSNTSLRTEAWRTPEEGLEDGRKILAQLQQEHLMSNTDAAAIYTSNKGRERSMAGFAAAMNFVKPDSAMTTSQFIRAAIIGSGPGGLVGQRWETLAAAAPELAAMLDDLSDEVLAPGVGKIADPTQRQNTIIAARNVAQANFSAAQAESQTRARLALQGNRAQLITLGLNAGLAQPQAQAQADAEVQRMQGEFNRLVALGQGSGLTQQQAVAQANATLDQQIAAQAQIAAMDRVLQGSGDEGAVDAAIEGFAALDAIYKPTGQISRKSAEYIKKTMAKEYTFAGVTRTGEEWIREIESGRVPAWVAEKFRQARFSYGAQAEGARQAGAVVGGGTPGQTPPLVPVP